MGSPILAVVVLYNMRIEASPACMGLAAYGSGRMGGLGTVLLMDNTAIAQPLPPGFAARYIHDGTNPGLARRYNQALAEAKNEGAAWLLLLDQDTRVTEEYLQELEALTSELAADASVVALAPKLMSQGQMQSPHQPQFQAPSFTLTEASDGVMPGVVRVYNSGALLRVSAVEGIGGFPEAYWLDYLDHAVFARLQQAGGRVFLMRSRLEHEMSIFRPEKRKEAGYAARHSNQLAAEVRFYHEHASEQERRAHRRLLLRQAIGSLRRRLWGDAMRFLRAGWMGRPA
jgi:GT2 family glycosyltransferase